MATEAERLVINLEARIAKFDADMRRAAGISDRQFSRIQKKAAETQASFRNFGAGIGRGIGLGIAALIGVESIRQVADYASEYRNLQNALKVAGLEGDNLTRVFNQLSQISVAQGAPLNGLVTLYSRASQSAKDLGASQDDLVRFSEGIAVALKVSGGSAESASGALLQLSQALGGAKIQAEEFNSINDGARPILQAVANGLKEAGGSVSRLKALVNDGKISNQAFFRAALAGFPSIAAQAEKAAPTVGQATERIQTAMLNLVGYLDKTTDASGKATTALNGVADVIQKLPGYIEAAASGLKQLQGYIQNLDRGSFLGGLRDAFGAPGLSTATPPPLLPSYPVSPANRINDAFSTTSGSSVETQTAGGKVGRLGQEADKAQISIKDFAVATDDATKAAKEKSSFPTSGAVSDYVSNVVTAESGGNRTIKNPNSSATGLGQFINSTFLRLFKANFPTQAANLSDQAILALRKDADISKALIEAYAEENANVLRSAGVAVNDAALHLSHFLGADDAVKVLKAAPGTPLQGLIDPKSIRANPTVLGGGRTVDDARAYAERRATGVRQAAGNFTPAEEKARDAVSAYNDVIGKGVEFIAEQNAEGKAVGQTAEQAAALRYEQELLNQAYSSGIALTPQQTAQIKQLAVGMAEAEGAAQRYGMAQQEFNDLAKDSLRGVIDDLIEGKSAGEAFANVLKNIGSRLLDLALDNLFSPKGGGGGLAGGLGGIISSLFGGFRAAGGPVRAGKPYVVGEKGPELVVPGRSGTVIPNHNLVSMQPRELRARSSAPVFTMGGTSITVQGDANAETLRQMRVELNARDARNASQLQRNIGKIYGQWDARN